MLEVSPEIEVPGPCLLEGQRDAFGEHPADDGLVRRLVHRFGPDEQAVAEIWPHYAAMFGRIGRERGWPAPTFERFIEEVRHGSVYAGSPETVARKIVHAVTALGAQRFDLKYSNGGLPHRELMRSVELYATEVAPRVRELLAEQPG